MSRNNEAVRETARLHARLPAHRRRVEAARSVIRSALALHPDAYVSFSAGKDSGVLLHLVMEQKPDIEARILTWPETRLLGDYDAVIAAWRQRGARIVEVSRHRESIRERNPEKWKALHCGATAYFVGLRAEESRGRMTSLRRFGCVHRLRNGLTRIAPLAWMSTDDIAAIVLTNGLPVLRTYHEHGFDSRTATRIIARPGMQETVMATLRRRDPVAYARLRDLYPEDKI